MPKRKEPVDEPEKVEEVVEKTAEESDGMKGDSAPRRDFFTEEQLMEMKNDHAHRLERIIKIYGIQPDKETRNTNKKLRELVLEKQMEIVKDSLETPIEIRNEFSDILFPNKEVAQASPIQELIQASNRRGEVTYAMAMLINTGNYENVRVETSVSLPLDFTDQDLKDAEEAMNVARKLVVEKLAKDAEEVRNDFVNG